MLGPHFQQLQNMAVRLQSEIDRQTSVNMTLLLKLEETATKYGAAWSGSSIGYHANVYYEDFSIPPPGEYFDAQWGFNQPFGLGRESSHWTEYVFQDVHNEIYIDAGDPDLAPLRVTSAEVTANFRRDQSRFESLISSASRGNPDGYLDELRARAASLSIPTLQDLMYHQLPVGRVGSRDEMATQAGLKYAPHQEILAEVRALRAPFTQSKELKDLCELAIDHLSILHGLDDQDERSSNLTVRKEGVDGTLLANLHRGINEKCRELYAMGHYPEAVEKGFKVVRDRLRVLTGYEKGAEAFSKGNLHIRGAAAPNVEKDFNSAVKYLTMAIDQFRNEKAHTSDANIDSERALEYLTLSSLAMNLLEKAEIGIPRERPEGAH